MEPTLVNNDRDYKNISSDNIFKTYKYLVKNHEKFEIDLGSALYNILFFLMFDNNLERNHVFQLCAIIIDHFIENLKKVSTILKHEKIDNKQLEILKILTKFAKNVYPSVYYFNFNKIVNGKWKLIGDEIMRDFVYDQ